MDALPSVGICNCHAHQRAQRTKWCTLFLFHNQPDAPIIQIYSVLKLHVLGIFSAHHQEFSTTHLALVSFMQV
jgi:hypothetical protein